MRIAVDTGGTFTDFVVLDDSGVRRFKLPSTPDEPARAIEEGCAFADCDFELVHGTTVATNAILEGKLVRTGLVVPEGFRDLLRLGRQSRPELYDWEPSLPDLPVLDCDIRTVSGRVAPDGSVLEPFAIPTSLDLEDCEAVAVCLLYSYANPGAEEAIARLIRAGAFASLSHRVSPETREYERACATVLNAAVGPIIGRYLGNIRVLSDDIGVMGSHGGLLSVQDAEAIPIRTVVSGPAGGVAATVAFGRRHARPNLIAFDMGGTSTDVTLIDDYRPSMTACADIAGLPVRLRRIDVHTIGCGGGSIALADSAGALRVGPISAGAVPGPALFGGPSPTVTDANYLLGRLPLAAFSGRMDSENCRTVMASLAHGLRISLEDCAQAIVDVADAHMAAAVRRVSAERGFEPSAFSLVAFGGAGGMHACAVAELLEITEILCPIGAGVFSAVGLLGAPYAWEESLGVIGGAHDWASTFAELESKARTHVPTGDVGAERIADMRYRGQSHELSVPANSTYEDAGAAFSELHRDTFGATFERREIEWVTARVRLHGAELKHPLISGDFGVDTETIGPAVIAQDDCTIFVADGWTAKPLSDGATRIGR
ncbi:MAG: hydantoinase/oxoprolinase family protein [Armatimonadota bacterium]|nr:hydantoinase/oxoprolinase family protein [Armatimonadota bacterium]